MILRNAILTDIQGVLDLQEKYLLVNTPENERQNGFVTTPFTVPQLEEIIALDGLFIAEYERKIVAYAFAGSWAYFSQWSIFPFMLNRLPDIKYQNFEINEQNSFQYGPVCIEMSYRGSGLFPRLFEVMRLAMRAHYPIGVTFINKINQRSYEAHTKKLKMEVVDEFTFNQKNFYGLAFRTNETVLC
jgi:hypothetical protein